MRTSMCFDGAMRPSEKWSARHAQRSVLVEHVGVDADGHQDCFLEAGGIGMLRRAEDFVRERDGETGEQRAGVVIAPHTRVCA